MKTKNCDAIILAAGKSKRFSKSTLKQYIKIDKKNIIDISIEKLKKISNIRYIYVMLQKSKTSKFNCSNNIFSLVGGRTRTESVFNGLTHIDNINNHPNYVLIHDAARPCVELLDIKKLFSNIKNMDGIALGYPLTNALKKVDSKLKVTDNIAKDNYYLSFTPQLYKFAKLLNAYNVVFNKNIEVEDEIEAMTKSMFNVHILSSSPKNIKLTYDTDIKIITKILK